MSCLYMLVLLIFVAFLRLILKAVVQRHDWDIPYLPVHRSLSITTLDR